MAATPSPDLPRPWHALDGTDVVRVLATDPEAGLSPEAAARRLDKIGPNRIPTRTTTPWYQALARQFADVLIGILAAAAVISLLLGDQVDALAILAIVLVNGALGFVQEWKAERALLALGALLAPHSRVIRGGRSLDVDAGEVVPGDLLVLGVGDRVPADARLLSTAELRADESSLTGESAGVGKRAGPAPRRAPLAERFSMVWMGTTITAGRGRAVVVATGPRSEFGRIAELTRSVREGPTPLERRLRHLGQQLGLLSLLAAGAIAATGALLGKPLLEMFFTGISLAVAAVPEGLPAVVTVTLALGVRQMVRRRALPRRLEATETLGAATVILTDKTGTLTENEMTVRRIWLAAGEVSVTGPGHPPEGGFQSDGRDLDPERRHLGGDGDR